MLWIIPYGNAVWNYNEAEKNACWRKFTFYRERRVSPICYYIQIYFKSCPAVISFDVCVHQAVYHKKRRSWNNTLCREQRVIKLFQNIALRMWCALATVVHLCSRFFLCALRFVCLSIAVGDWIYEWEAQKRSQSTRQISKRTNFRPKKARETEKKTNLTQNIFRSFWASAAATRANQRYKYAQTHTYSEKCSQIAM